MGGIKKTEIPIVFGNATVYKDHVETTVETSRGKVTDTLPRSLWDKTPAGREFATLELPEGFGPRAAPSPSPGAPHPSNKVTVENLGDVFTYHSPRGDQAGRYLAIRAAAKAFADVVLWSAPDCADRSTAIRSIREAVMWANAAVALEPPAGEPAIRFTE